MLERGDTIGHTWAHLYDGLVLHTGKHFSALPGLPFPSSAPLFPTRRDLLDYLFRYAEQFRVPVETQSLVETAYRQNGGWIVTVKGREPLHANAVVVASGIVSNPHVPDIPNRTLFKGQIIHSVDYRRPEPFAHERVLVVGAGNSGGEIAAELAAAGARVTVAIRSGVRVVPRQMMGIPIQYFGLALQTLPQRLTRSAIALTATASAMLRGPSPLPPPADSPCAKVPLIGFHLSDGVKEGRIHLRRGISAFTAGGVRFVDGVEEEFDCVILATGYRAAVGILGSHVTVDRCGFAARVQQVVSTDRPDLYFVGHNYDASGGLRNIARDARIAARLIAGRLRDSGRTYTGRPRRTSER